MNALALINEQILDLSTKLKTDVSRFELESYAGFFTFFLRYRNDHPNFLDFSVFESPYKDFNYLVMLNASSQRGSETYITQRDLNKWGVTLRKIKDLHQEANLSQVNAIDDRAKAIHHLSFHSYFENGSLSYSEQDLERLAEFFRPFDGLILSLYGFDSSFLVDFYLFSETLHGKKINIYNAFKSTDSFKLLYESAKNDQEPDEEVMDLFFSLPDSLREAMHKLHQASRFHPSEFYERFGKDRVDKLIEIFSLEATQDESFLFFTQNNPLDQRPILCLPDGHLLFFYQKQLPISFAGHLYEILQKGKKADKVRKHRDTFMELKTKEIMQRLFNGKVNHISHSYHIEKNTEQDILVLSSGLALIIEIKASKFREPFRNSEKGFIRIRDDFKASIQYGYEQAARVERFFLAGKEFEIKDKKERVLYKVNPKKYPNVFTIIVTLERFGPIQTDLSLLLNIEKQQRYPWSVYIDDLEAITLALIKLYNNPLPPFTEYLKIRSKMHGGRLCRRRDGYCRRFPD